MFDMPGVLRLNVISAEDFRTPEEKRRFNNDPAWRELRLEVIKRDGGSCRICGYRSPGGAYMEVHHIEGNHRNNSPENLLTLCPLCHSCHHIGLAGIKGNGRLLIMKQEVDQQKLNRLILETAAGYGEKTPDALEQILKNLPVEKDLGAQGLVELANVILTARAGGEIRQLDARYIFWPEPLKFPLIKKLMEGG